MGLKMTNVLQKPKSIQVEDLTLTPTEIALAYNALKEAADRHAIEVNWGKYHEVFKKIKYAYDFNQIAAQYIE